MASTVFFLITIFLTFSASSSSSSGSSSFDALVTPITKDASTSLYTISLNSGGSFVISLTSPFLWQSCPRRHPNIPCGSRTCAAANAFPPSPGCPVPRPPANRRRCSCTVSPANPATGACGYGNLTYTDITISTTDGHNPLAPATARDVVSACAPRSIFAGLPAGASGVAGLARSRGVDLAQQLSSKLKIPTQFGLCLPGGSTSPGVAFFGSPPFYLLSQRMTELTTLLSYTPLLNSPHADSDYYFIAVENIAINLQAVPVASRILSRYGGAKLRTTLPYTAMATGLYRRFISAFNTSTSGYVRKPAVAQFELCYDSTKLGSTRVGYGVPQIDLVLAGTTRNWTIFGANSMKQVSDDTACLAVVDGGRDARPALAIGGFQMENNFLLFDLERSRLGFSNILFGIETTCGNFNFTPAGASAALAPAAAP